jgi:D-alanyl-D-alanine carboxypeptidase
MTLNKKIVALIIGLSVFTLKPAYSTPSSVIINSIQRIIDEDRVKYNIPGIEVSVSFPGNDTPYDFVSGSTTVEGSQPLKPSNLLQIGSETKSFTAATMLLLEAEGKLSLDDLIIKYISDLPPTWNKITIRQLLNHTSGISEYSKEKYFTVEEIMSDLRREWLPQELVGIAKTRPLYFQPGNGWHYSNTNYVLAGMIINAVTGQSVQDVMNTHLFQPLLLSNTYFVSQAYDETIMSKIAHGYSKMHIFAGEPHDVIRLNMSAAFTAGAILSTTHDVNIWFRKLTNGTLLGNKQASLESLVDEDTGLPISSASLKQGYGLGIQHDFDTFGEETWFHNGSTLGYSAWMVWLKNRDIVITTAITDATPDNKDSDVLIKDIITYLQAS